MRRVCDHGVVNRRPRRPNARRLTTATAPLASGKPRRVRLRSAAENELIKFRSGLGARPGEQQHLVDETETLASLALMSDKCQRNEK